MRPRPSPTRFNEAAAYHCGKRVLAVPAHPARQTASMRPQHITAENRLQIPAAGIPFGRFNEAAAYHCGKRGVSAPPARRTPPASMRPQHITAENSPSTPQQPSGQAVLQ